LFIMIQTLLWSFGGFLSGFYVMDFARFDKRSTAFWVGTALFTLGGVYRGYYGAPVINI